MTRKLLISIYNRALIRERAGPGRIEWKAGCSSFREEKSESKAKVSV